MSERRVAATSGGVFFGWYVVGACFALALFGWGLGFYGPGVYLAELRRIHGWPTSTIATATTLYYLVAAVLVAFTADAIDRFGPRMTAGVGIVAMGAGAGAMPFIDSPWQLYLAFLTMSVGWATMTTTMVTTVLARWFRRRRGLAISLALNGASCGGILIAPALVWMTAAWGFATALPVMIAVMLAVLVPVLLLALPAAPERLGLAPDGDPVPTGAPPVPPPAERRSRLLRDLAFWSVAAPFALGLAAQVGFLTHQIAFLEPSLGRGGAGLAVALTTAAAVAGRLLMGLVIDRLDPRLTTAATLASQAAAIMLMLVADSPLLLYVACVWFGFSVGNLITLPALTVQRAYHPAAFGVVVALATAVSQFTYAFGPGLLGLARDLAGGYGAALLLCILLQLAGAAVALFGRRTAGERKGGERGAAG